MIPPGVPIFELKFHFQDSKNSHSQISPKSQGALNRPDTVRITAPESLRYHAIIYIQALNATQNDFDVLRVDLSTHTQETATKAF